MVMDIKDTYCGDRFAMYTNVYHYVACLKRI